METLTLSVVIASKDLYDKTQHSEKRHHPTGWCLFLCPPRRLTHGNKTDFDYYYGDESNQFSFYRIPRQFVTGEAFHKLSTDAKLLYGLLLDRMGLSLKNGWFDDAGRAFIYYTLEDIQNDLNCGHEKAVKLLSELDTGKRGIGLIERRKQGQGHPTKIYVKRFTTRNIPPQTLEPQPTPRLPKIGR